MEFFPWNKRWIITGAMAVFILGGAGFALLRWQRKAAPVEKSAGILQPIVTSNQTEKPPPGSQPSFAVSGLAYRGEPITHLSPDPDVLTHIPEGTFEKSKTELSSLARTIAQNPIQPEPWMRLAFIRQFYRDYAGTRDVYEYLNVVADYYSLPFYNLGELYGYYLKDPRKAIEKYQEAIRRDLLNVSYYVGFAQFYRDGPKDFSSAEKVLLEGFRQIPNDVNFPVALAATYAAWGKVPEAIAQYEKALGYKNLGAGERNAILAELERLKKASGVN